ncbi:probable arylsulfatase [Rhynchosporium secalis]|uniref:Arylsulfatase n=1 Tax=Rhynchosporium secalis TaxID=38038 RepID=A0A1E1M646_RHYSE|nr:probable arylsulfatase [Rhynchosporium secalis]
MKIYLGYILAIAGFAAAEESSQEREQALLNAHRVQDSRPNIVVILTDDQDVHLQSLDYMPLLKKHILDEGTSYTRHYCTTAICCPSRVTLWTGKNAHNTNVTDVFPPYGITHVFSLSSYPQKFNTSSKLKTHPGGYPKFISQGFNSNWLPIWLQQANYSTYYTGKLFNAHTITNYNSPHPAGWTSSDFLLDPHTYQYLNATFQRNTNSPVSHPGEYSTDVLAEKAYGLLAEAIESKKPFFLTAAPIGPHADVAPYPEVPGKDHEVHMTAPIPAPRHAHLFPNVKVPRTANFNPDTPSGASWVKHLAKLSPEVLAYNDAFYRARLQALQAVDELVEGLVQRLEKYGVLENTYIIFSSDNGYHISQHRLPPGKECGFEEDINVPFIIRGPGVAAGKEVDVVTTHTDFVPTVLKLVGAKTGWEGLDGSSIPLFENEIEEAKEKRQEHVNVEFWGRSIPEGIYKFSLDNGKFVAYGLNNTYKALRVLGRGYNLYYAVWCTNEHELYDLTTDPGQLKNLYPTTSSHPQQSIFNLPLFKVLPRLDALLMVTKSCKASTCIDPWSVIHPEGDVHTLGDALASKFDAFYGSIAERVSFSKCELGYILESEGPQDAVVFRSSVDYENILGEDEL